MATLLTTIAECPTATCSTAPSQPPVTMKTTSENSTKKNSIGPFAMINRCKKGGAVSSLARNTGSRPVIQNQGDDAGEIELHLRQTISAVTTLPSIGVQITSVVADDTDVPAIFSDVSGSVTTADNTSRLSKTFPEAAVVLNGFSNQSLPLYGPESNTSELDCKAKTISSLMIETENDNTTKSQSPASPDNLQCKMVPNPDEMALQKADVADLTPEVKSQSSLESVGSDFTYDLMPNDTLDNGLDLFPKQATCEGANILESEDGDIDEGVGTADDAHNSKTYGFRYLCQQAICGKQQPDEDDENELVVKDGRPVSSNELQPRSNHAEATYEALCSCMGHEQFSDVLGASLHVDNFSGRLDRVQRKEKQRKKKLKKKSKPGREAVLLSSIQEETQATSSPAQCNTVGSDSDTAALVQNLSLPQTHKDSQLTAPIKLVKPVPTKTKRSIFRVFKQKKKRKDTSDEPRDIFSLIESNTFMERIMHEIQMETQQVSRSPQDTNADLLAEQIAIEAVKKCLEDSSC
jgi:hypothetical protein